MIKSILWPDSNHDQNTHYLPKILGFECDVLLIAIERNAKSEHVCMQFPMVCIFAIVRNARLTSYLNPIYDIVRINIITGAP